MSWMRIGIASRWLPCDSDKDLVGKEELYTRVQIIVEYLESQWVKSSERRASCG